MWFLVNSVVASLFMFSSFVVLFVVACVAVAWWLARLLFVAASCWWCLLLWLFCVCVIVVCEVFAVLGGLGLVGYCLILLIADLGGVVCLYFGWLVAWWLVGGVVLSWLMAVGGL